MSPTSIFPTCYAYKILSDLSKWVECVVLAVDPERQPPFPGKQLHHAQSLNSLSLYLLCVVKPCLYIYLLSMYFGFRSPIEFKLKEKKVSHYSLKFLIMRCFVVPQKVPLSGLFLNFWVLRHISVHHSFPWPQSRHNLV